MDASRHLFDHRFAFNISMRSPPSRGGTSRITDSLKVRGWEESYPVTHGLAPSSRTLIPSFSVIGFLGAGSATYSAILELSTTSFQKPCYLFSTQPNNNGHTNCCGKTQLISRYNDTQKCSDPDLDYYT